MGRRGFTLIELLIAVTILTVMMGIVFATFSTVVNATESTRQEAKWLRRQQFLARSFESNFPTAYLDATAQQAAYEFVGTSEEGKDGPKDSVTFISTASLIGGASLPGDVKQVHYELVESSSSLELGYEDMPENQKRGSMIRATETPLLGSDLSSQLNSVTQSTGMGLSPTKTKANTGSFGKDTSAVMSPEWTLPEIRSMDISYFDGIKYVDEWDSNSYGRLPWYVDIKINYWKTQDELDQERRDGIDSKENPDFEMVIPIAMGVGVTEAANANPTGANQPQPPEDLNKPPN